MLVATYEQWREAKTILFLNDLDDAVEEAPVDAKAMVECPECDGSGEITDEGVRTGQEFEATCPDCDGDGKVLASSVDREEVAIPTTFHDYEKELRQDLLDLALWTSRPAYVVLSEAGFLCWTSLDTKTLQCTLIHPNKKTTYLGGHAC